MAGSAFACGGADGSAEPFGDVTVGAVSDFPVGTLKRAGSAPVIVGHDAQGLYALTTTCTHQGSTVGVVSATSLRCPQHGSTFNANGDVTGGPATRPLVHYAVEVMGTNLVVHGGTQVPASTRVMA